MKVTTPTKVRWQKSVANNTLDGYSKKKRKRISQILDNNNLDIHTEFEELSEKHLAWFMPMYTETISKKENGVIHNIKETTLGTELKTYHILSIYEGSTPIGGTIFTIRKKSLGIAYRIYPNDWTQHSLAANPSLFSDYIITEHARSLSKEFVSHGMDRNIYGLNSAIGLATFKMSVGYEPYIPYKPEFCEIDINQFKDEALVFHTPQGDLTKIVTATLIQKENAAPKHGQLLKYLAEAEIETTVVTI